MLHQTRPIWSWMVWQGVWVTKPLSLHWWSHSLLLIKRWAVAWYTGWGHATHRLLARWGTRCSMLLIHHAPISRHAIVRRTIRILSHWGCCRCALHTRIGPASLVYWRAG